MNISNEQSNDVDTQLSFKGPLMQQRKEINKSPNTLELSERVSISSPLPQSAESVSEAALSLNKKEGEENGAESQEHANAEEADVEDNDKDYREREGGEGEEGDDEKDDHDDSEEDEDEEDGEEEGTEDEKDDDEDDDEREEKNFDKEKDKMSGKNLQHRYKRKHGSKATKNRGMGSDHESPSKGTAHAASRNGVLLSSRNKANGSVHSIQSSYKRIGTIMNNVPISGQPMQVVNKLINPSSPNKEDRYDDSNDDFNDDDDDDDEADEVDEEEKICLDARDAPMDKENSQSLVNESQQQQQQLHNLQQLYQEQSYGIPRAPEVFQFNLLPLNSVVPVPNGNPQFKMDTEAKLHLLYEFATMAAMEEGIFSRDHELYEEASELADTGFSLTTSHVAYYVKDSGYSLVERSANL